ncbi:hypothetical protein ABZ424_22005 [Streptomyces sp. NPDC005790]|uniref:hypothetical protein n=1 Tax=Streptomyces sp. NPDC005790 TaxID=3154777 RepID=UPI00340753E2
MSSENLTKLADDLDEMQRYLDRQVRRMDAVVDAIEARWEVLDRASIGKTVIAELDLPH